MRIFMVVVLLTTGLAESTPAQGRPSIESVIEWLPTNIETVVVAHGPLDVADTSRDTSFFLATVIADMVAVGPAAARRMTILEPLRGSHLRFAVEGARAFRPPHGLGLAPYDGCHIAVFEDSDAPRIESFLRAVQAAGDSAVQIAGASAIRIRWHAEGDDWSAFVVRLRPNVIITSTSESMLAELLERATHGGTGRALPSSLPEWSGLDTTARVWGLRHYVHGGDDRDPTSPLSSGNGVAKALDTLAIGVTVSITSDSAGVIARYFSRNPQAMIVAQRIWAHQGYPPGPSFGSDVNGVVRISVVPTSRDTRSLWMLVVMGVLGHAIFL